MAEGSSKEPEIGISSREFRTNPIVDAQARFISINQQNIKQTHLTHEWSSRLNHKNLPIVGDTALVA